MMPRFRQQQRGVAIIMAILIVALAVSVASYAAWQQNLWIRQTENLDRQAQALAVARAGINFGRAVLAEDAKDDVRKGTGDSLDENWAKYGLTVPVEGGSVAGKIQDQQGLYNLNNLAVTNPVELKFQREVFQRLLTHLDLPSALVDSVADWVDEDSDGPKEDLAYLGKPEPYRTANQFMVDIEELYRLEGFTDENIKKLRPFVTAIPAHRQQQPPGQSVQVEPTPINVNTAPKEVLDALFEGKGEELMKLREKTAFKNQDDFGQRTQNILNLGAQPAQGAQGQSGEPAAPDQPNTGTPAPGRQQAQQQTGDGQPHAFPLTFGKEYGVKSEFFLVAATGYFGRAQVGLAALVRRINGPKPTQIIWQKQVTN
jgi:general secretion pathway protein K